MPALFPLSTAIGRQLRNPSGIGGVLVGYSLAVANRKSNRIAIDALEISPHETVLELGFGPGRSLKMLKAMTPHGTVLGIDHSPTMLAQACRHNRRAIRDRRIHLLRGRIDALPCGADSIDKILAVHVVYFFGVTEVREVRRVLCPGGCIAILATDKSAMVHRKFTRSSTHNTFDLDGLRALLLRGGFAEREIAISQLKVAFGIPTLLAIATKTVTSSNPAARPAASCRRSE